MMKNVVNCAERDVSGLSEVGKQCDKQTVCPQGKAKIIQDCLVR